MKDRYRYTKTDWIKRINLWAYRRIKRIEGGIMKTLDRFFTGIELWLKFHSPKILFTILTIALGSVLLRFGIDDIIIRRNEIRLQVENQELRCFMETQDGRKLIRWELFPANVGSDSVVGVWGKSGE